MILDSDLVVPAMEPAATVESTERGLSLRWSAISLLLFFSLAVILQLASGAYTSEFSGYPDEPAHYVTSVMVCDYIRHFHFESPLKFAQQYYDHYPKVAFGHWPPFFYMVQAAWMLLFSASRASVRIESAVTAALLAWSLAKVVYEQFGRWSALCAGLLLVCTPLIQTYTSEEMSELLLTLVCFWSAVYFSRYLQSERLRDALLFGVYFALAVLTKGNGWLLAMIPAIAMLLTGKWRLVLSRNFWAPVLLVTVLCVPWQLITMRMAERGWDGGSKPSVHYTATALLEFVGLFEGIFGPVLWVVFLVGVLFALMPARRKLVTPTAAVMFALIVAVWVFHSLVPAGVEDRKLVIAVPAMIYFLVLGTNELIARLPNTRAVRRSGTAGLLATLALAFGLGVFQIPKVEHYGFDEAARYLAAHPDLESSKILVSSDSVGEGLLLSELAMLHPDPRGQVIRATKALATVDWTGAHYECLVKSVPELLDYLKDHNVRVIVVDVFPPLVHFQHDDLLRKAVHAGAFTRLASFPASSGRNVPAGRIEIYRFNL